MKLCAFRVLLGLGVFTCSQQVNAQAATPSVLPPNPQLVSPVPPAPDAVPIAETKPQLARVRVGVNGGIASRPARSEVATYAAGFTWGGHVGIAVFPWLGVRAASQVSSHGVEAHDGAWGLSNPGFDPPRLRELALAGSLELRRDVAPRLAVWGGGGVAWTRISMSKFLLEEPWPAAVETRHGVTIELPLHVGVGYALGRPVRPLELAVTVEFRFSPVLSSSGQLFAPSGGQSQSVRSDTGARVEIGGVPGVEAARIVLLGLEAAF